MPKHDPTPPAPPGLAVGARLASVLAVAYRARRPVLLEGPTGIGKSEMVAQTARALGVASIVLDLSLLEPPDLVGLPFNDGGRTAYALPRFLPTEGTGILMLEELNRAERYIQQPALQLLSARRLHDYELPAGWVCFAAINPERGEYQVTPLDAALRARFLTLSVRADRASWLAWANENGVHPAVLGLAKNHDRLLEGAPPRTWVYVSQILHAMTPAELADAGLLRDLLAGYLPPAWVETLVASRAGWGDEAELDLRALLVGYGPGTRAADALRAFRDRGRTDRIDELAHRLVGLVQGPELGVLVGRGEVTLASLEALLGDLPGDARERLQEALVANPTASTLTPLDPRALLADYGTHAKSLLAWADAPLLRHRTGLAVAALRAHLQNGADLVEIRRTNAARAALGRLIADLGVRRVRPLVDALNKLNVSPLRPGAGSA